MPDPDLVAYLTTNLKNFPAEDLRKQLASEGVSEQDFDEALKLALRAPAPLEKPVGTKKKGVVFLLTATGAVMGLGAFLLLRPPPQAPERAPQIHTEYGESAFIGRSGYVIRLPQDYSAVVTYKDAEKTHETVHFCRIGTDPTQFGNQGLFAQLGIVRLDVSPDPGAGTPRGLEYLFRLVASEAERHREKFTQKDISVGPLRGFALQYDTPFPRLETYILGNKVRYTFLAGQDDEIYRDILNSLRETESEG